MRDGVQLLYRVMFLPLLMPRERAEHNMPYAAAIKVCFISQGA